MRACSQHDVDIALSKLRSLHDGEIGLVETIACGEAAIPALRGILNTPEPSGIYETRCRAVDALASLKALDVLREYLATPREISDPVERTGEDAVINAATRALGRVIDKQDLPLLFRLIESRPLAGVIEALGKFRQISALPYFIGALGDDFLRPSAEQAICRLGIRVPQLLSIAALDRDPPEGHEAPASKSRRRSALKLLERLRPPHRSLSPALQNLVDDSDPWIALRATRLCLPVMSRRAASHAMEKLIAHLRGANPLLAEEIEDVLVKRFALAAPYIVAKETEFSSSVPVWRELDRTAETLARVRRRVGEHITK